MNRIYFIIILILLFNYSFSQTVKDYFIPADGLKMATFKNDIDDRITTYKYSAKDSIYIVKTALSWKMIDYLKQTSHYIITNEEVIKIYWQQEFAGADKITENLTDGIIELKLPIKDSSVEWKYKDFDKKYLICKSEFTKIKVNEDNKNAIIVTCKYISGDGKVKEEEGYIIKYYVEGIGLYKTETFLNNGQIDSLLELIKIK